MPFTKELGKAWIQHAPKWSSVRRISTTVAWMTLQKLLGLLLEEDKRYVDVFVQGVLLD
jgi:hypothetical protein